ncbi:hypothetical protein GCM10023116_43880 [Kistimonas scapharcae]|uniref:Uncharacterized protein n=2 Tax=Kistimonas scapharcae TaxID=1036133 RepID=A0ABP8V808_9GAMM
MSGCPATFKAQKKLIKLLNGASNTIELIQDTMPDSGTISQIAPNCQLNFFCFNEYTEQYTNKKITNQRLQSSKRKLHQQNDNNTPAETKLAIKTMLDFIKALEQKRLPENFPTDKQLNICEAIVEQDFAHNKAKDAPDDFDFFITNLYTQVNVGPIDMVFVRNLGRHMRKKANPIALEIYAGNGMLSRSLEEYGVLAIAIDICLSHYINEDSIKTVYFSLATHAIYRFTALIKTLREIDIPVSPFVLSIYPQSPDEQSFGRPMLDLFEKIPGLEIITIGAKPLQHLAPNHRLSHQMKHFDLTEDLAYRSNGLMDTTDRVYTNYTGMR